MTVVAVILIVAGFLFILGGVIFAWAIRRQPALTTPSSFYKFLTHRSRESDDAISIESWHDGSEENPEATRLWRYTTLVSPERAHITPHLDYIPYNGPVEPPRLPLPMALRALVNRPLPPLPGEPRTEPEPTSDLMGALLLRLGSKKVRKTASITPPSQVALQCVSTCVSGRASGVRGESMLSEATIVTNTTITKAFNGRRSAAKVLHYEADGMSRRNSILPSACSAPTPMPCRWSSPPPMPALPAHKVKRWSSNADVLSNASPYHVLTDSTDSFNSSLLASYPTPPGASPLSHLAAPPPSPSPQTMTLTRALSATIPTTAGEVARASSPKNVLSGLPQRRSDPMPLAQGPTLLTPPRPRISYADYYAISTATSYHAVAMPSMPAPVHYSNTTKTMLLASDNDARADPFNDPGGTN